MIQNPAFGFYLLISDFLVKSHTASKNQQQRSVILQYGYAPKTSLIL